MSDSPARFSNGISTVKRSDVLGYYGLPDPTPYHTYFDDFDQYAATDWVITTTEAGAGSATEAVSQADGGILVLTNDAADNDLDNLQLSLDGGTTTAEMFQMAAGKKAFFKTRFKLNDGNSAITDVDALVGLAIGDASLIASAPSDGIYFLKTDGAATVDLHVRLDGTSSTLTLGTMVYNTYHTLAWYYDGGTTAAGSKHIHGYFDGAYVGSIATTNLCTDEPLCPSISVMNGRASASIMSMDYIFAAKER